MSLIGNAVNAFKSIKHGIDNIIHQKTEMKFTINKKDYFEDKLIAEGGYGYVYAVSDSKGKKYALKKMNIISDNQMRIINQELLNWRKINNGPNIVKLLDFEIKKSYVLILMEYCSEGSLLDFINCYDGDINEVEALEIIRQISIGLNGMHSMNPPVCHRDIKIENILKFGNTYKLCDFGSASSEVMDPRNETKNSIQSKFSVYERTTTFMYRPPEMVDEYSNYIVNEKVDIWAIGCILYILLFKMHPFQDAQKLTITTAHYYMPKESLNYSQKLIDFIRLLLTPNPSNRPNIKQVLQYIQKWNNITQIQLSPEVIEIKKKQEKHLNEKSTNKGDISTEELLKAKKAIMKDLKKKNKYKRKDDTDINDLFDDGDEYYKSNPEKRSINENRMNQNNNAGNLLFDFNSGFGGENKNSSTQKSENILGFDFNYSENINKNEQKSSFNFSNSQQEKNSNNNNNPNNNFQNFGFNFEKNFSQNKPQNPDVNLYAPLEENKNSQFEYNYNQQYSPHVPEQSKAPHTEQNILEFFK